MCKKQVLFIVIMVCCCFISGCGKDSVNSNTVLSMTPTLTIPTKEAEPTPTEAVEPTKEAEPTPTEAVEPTKEAEPTPTEAAEPTKEAKPTPTETPQPTQMPTPTPVLEETIPEEYQWTEYTGQVTELAKSKVGDIVHFGKYNLDDNRYNGRETLCWQVIDKNNDDYFLLCLYYIDCRAYMSSASWESSALRDWLNNGFIAASFHVEKEQPFIMNVEMYLKTNPWTNAAESEKETICDKVFLISEEDKGSAFVRPALWVRTEKYMFDCSGISMSDMEAIPAPSKEEQLSNAKQIARKKLEERYGKRDLLKIYTEEKAALFQNTFDSALSDIDRAETVEEVESIFITARDALMGIEKIPTFWETTNIKVKEAYDKKMQEEHSRKNWVKLRLIEQEFALMVRSCNGKDAYLELMNKTIEEMNSISTTVESRKEEARSQWKQDCGEMSETISDIYAEVDKKLSEASSISVIDEILTAGQYQLSMALEQERGLPEGFLGIKELQGKIDELKQKYPYYPAEDITLLVVGANLDDILMHTVFQLLGITTEAEYCEKAEHYKELLLDRSTAAIILYSRTNGYPDEFYVEQKLDYIEYIRMDELFCDEKLKEQAKAIEDCYLVILNNSIYLENNGVYAAAALRSYVSGIYPEYRKQVVHFPYKLEELELGSAAEYLLKDWAVYMTRFGDHANYGSYDAIGVHIDVDVNSGSLLILENPFYEVYWM